MTASQLLHTRLVEMPMPLPKVTEADLDTAIKFMDRATQMTNEDDITVCCTESMVVIDVRVGQEMVACGYAHRIVKHMMGMRKWARINNGVTERGYRVQRGNVMMFVH